MDLCSHKKTIKDDGGENGNDEYEDISTSTLGQKCEERRSEIASQSIHEPVDLTAKFDNVVDESWVLVDGTEELQDRMERMQLSS